MCIWVSNIWDVKDGITFLLRQQFHSGSSKGQKISLINLFIIHIQYTRGAVISLFFSPFFTPARAHNRKTCLCFVASRSISPSSSSSSYSSLTAVLLLLPEWLPLNTPLGWTINYSNDRPLLSGALNRDTEKERDRKKLYIYRSLP